MANIVKYTRMENIRNRLKESFSLMDSDADGYLDYHEMKAALKALGFVVKKSYILAVIRMYDKFGCNKISFEDFYFVAAEKLNRQYPLNEIDYVFKLLTTNSTNNRITLQVLQELNKKFEYNLTDEEMELMITEFDLNHDGSIDQREFTDIMMDYTM